MSQAKIDTLVQETKDIWNQNATFWDEKMGDGNQFQRILIAPTTERLLQIQPGELVLDVACGNGNFTRRLVELGAKVVASDFSHVFIERARVRAPESEHPIEYRVIDATKRDDLLALGKQRFDAIVCSMALMDMVTIEPLFEAVSQLLKPNGRFVFSLTHPCFNSSQFEPVMEEKEVEGEIIVRLGIKTWTYISPLTYRGLGMMGQPTPQYYFHRSLSQIFQSCFQAGLVIDGLEEPIFGPDDHGKRPFSWPNFKEIPPVLVVRLRLKNSSTGLLPV